MLKKGTIIQSIEQRRISKSEKNSPNPSQLDSQDSIQKALSSYNINMDERIESVISKVRDRTKRKFEEGGEGEKMIDFITSCYEFKALKELEHEILQTLRVYSLNPLYSKIGNEILGEYSPFVPEDLKEDAVPKKKLRKEKEEKQGDKPKQPKIKIRTSEFLLNKVRKNNLKQKAPKLINDAVNHLKTIPPNEAMKEIDDQILIHNNYKENRIKNNKELPKEDIPGSSLLSIKNILIEYFENKSNENINSQNISIMNMEIEMNEQKLVDD